MENPCEIGYGIVGWQSLRVYVKRLKAYIIKHWKLGREIPFMLRTFLFSQLISQISMAKFHVFCMDTLIEISVGGDGIAILGSKLVKKW